MVVLYEEILLPPFVSAPVNVGVVVLPTSSVFTKSFGLMPPRTVFVLEYKGVVEVEMKTSLVVVVVVGTGKATFSTEVSTLVSGDRMTSGGCVEVLWCVVSSEWLRT